MPPIPKTVTALLGGVVLSLVCSSTARAACVEPSPPLRHADLTPPQAATLVPQHVLPSADNPDQSLIMPGATVEMCSIASWVPGWSPTQDPSRPRHSFSGTATAPSGRTSIFRHSPETSAWVTGASSTKITCAAPMSAGCSRTVTRRDTSPRLKRTKWRKTGVGIAETTTSSCIPRWRPVCRRRGHRGGHAHSGPVKGR